VKRKPLLTLKTISFLTIAVLANSFGNLLLAIGMDSMPSFSMAILPHYSFVLLTSPFILPGMFLSAVYMFTQLSLFSWADLSFVVPVIASSYVVTTLLSEFILGESVELQRWLGVVLITIGVAFVMRTTPNTHAEVEEIK
jgi:drug/metabolite transporter (DMT)-like permease